LHSLAEFGKYVVIAEQSRFAYDLTRRPDSPVVIPPVSADKLGTVKQVGAAPPRSASVGRLNIRDHTPSACVEVSQPRTTHHRAPGRLSGAFRAGG
jgi:hypothetical protein